MTIPHGIRPESSRNGDRLPPDSALSQPASQNSQPLPTSSRNDAQTARATEQTTTARLAEIHWLDAFTIAAITIRPDWNPTAVRAVIARTRGNRREVATAVLRAACDPEVRHPGAIENFDDRHWRDVAPTFPTIAELRASGAIRT